MSFLAIAGVGSSLIGGIATISAGTKAANAQRDATEKNAQLQREQNAEARRQYDLARADLAPRRGVGNNALYKLSNLMGLSRGDGFTQSGIGYANVANPYNDTPYGGAYGGGNPDILSYGTNGGFMNAPQFGGGPMQFGGGPMQSMPGPAQDNGEFGALDRSFTLADFNKDPGYEFRRTEGQRGVEQSAAARGGILSGNALKAISRYNQDSASNEYGAAYGRFNNDMTTRFNRLASLADMGQTATSAGIASGDNYIANRQQGANNLMSNNNAAANARASSYINTGNAISGVANNIGGFFAMRDLYKTPSIKPNSVPGGRTPPYSPPTDWYGG